MPLGACVDDDDEDELSLELIDLSPVWFSWAGGEAGARVSGVSCVSHDAVRLVPGPRVPLVSRATVVFLNVSSVPVFGLFSPPLLHSLSQQCARGLSLTCLTRSLFSHAVFVPLWNLFTDDNPRCSGAKRS